MPLTLVTGPANAAKAGVVFEGLRAVLAREPLLVVPTSADVDHYQRELAADGVVYGVRVIGFDRLLGDIGRRARVTGCPLGRVARQRVVAAAVSDVELTTLATVAVTPGFADSLGRLFSDLQGARIGAPRWTQALRAWAAGGPTRTGFAEDVAALYAAYRRRLERLGRPDADGHGWVTLDALALAPSAWGGRPVAFYGWDDLTPLQLATVDVLARVCDADVTVALAYEPGRAAFAGRAGAFEELRPLADGPGGRHVVLPERAEHYAAPAREALHHLERHLFESGPATTPAAETHAWTVADRTEAGRVDPGRSVRLLESGGERPEAELVAAEVLDLLRDGFAAEEIALVVRSVRRSGPLLAQVLAEYGVPVAFGPRRPLGATPLAGGALAAARAALPDGSATDLLRWLRAPGRLVDPAFADDLERRVRRAEAETAAEARRLAPSSGPLDPADAGAPPPVESPAPDPFAPLEALAAAAQAGPVALLAAIEAEALRAFEAPRHRTGAVLDGDGVADAEELSVLRRAITELIELGEADPGVLGEPADLLRALGAVETPAGVTGRGGVLVTDPLAIRARRFRAVVVCGLQDGEFPAQPAPDPFFDDDRRRELADATGLRLPRRPGGIEAERYLLYAAVSRPQERLLLSYRTSDEEGDPAVPSPFVDDVRALFTAALDEGRRRRLLADVAWPPAEAPTPHELRRALAASGPRAGERALAAPADADVLAGLAARRRFAARELEAQQGCGVRWLVESVLRPVRLDADSEPLRRGSLAHLVLHATLERLGEDTGSRRITPESLPAAERALDETLTEHARRRPLAPGTARSRAALRRLEIDLRRLLAHEAAGAGPAEPTHLEWRFGGADDAHGPLALAPGVELAGRVDRIDVAGDRAVVRDYKSSAAPPVARWADSNTLQAPLYALAARALLDLEPVAALYQPLSKQLTARGLVRADAPLPAGVAAANDVRDAEGFDSALDQARTAALDAVAAIRRGEIEPCPSTCAPNGCAYPGICRAEGIA